MDDTQLRSFLENAQVIAVVGASTNPAKAAGHIPRMLLDAGYTVIPVNPHADEILGQRAYPTLADVRVPIDIVDVFRPADEAPSVAQQAVRAGAGALWLQLGIRSDEARATATRAGLTYIEDLCLGATVHRLGVQKPSGQKPSVQKPDGQKPMA